MRCKTFNCMKVKNQSLFHQRNNCPLGVDRSLMQILFPSQFEYIDQLVQMGKPMQLEIALYLLMRSLYTNDIPGAKPTIRYYDKSLIRERHLQEIERFGNKQKRIIDWYEPLKRHVQPLENSDFPLKTSFYNPNTNEMMSPILSPARSIPKVAGKITQSEFSLNKSAILSQSGLSSLSQKDLDYSPYFPHKYRDYDREYPNKWTGKRDWNEVKPSLVELPATTNQYFPKWS